MIKTSKDTGSEKAKGCFTVKNDRGLHTRPSTELVKCATKFHANIKLRYQQMEVDAKSILGILMLAAAKGAKITISATGDDAEEAVNTIISLAENNFYVKY